MRNTVDFIDTLDTSCVDFNEAINRKSKMASTNTGPTMTTYASPNHNILRVQQEKHHNSRCVNSLGNSSLMTTYKQE